MQILTLAIGVIAAALAVYYAVILMRGDKQ